MGLRTALGTSRIHTQWSRDISPVIEVESGAEIEFTVVDAANGQITPTSGDSILAALDLSAVNPVTGPVYVKGAEPGDSLSVEILEVTVGPWGWTGIIPGFGLLADEFPDPWLRISEIDHAAGTVDFAPGVTLPLDPFPGTIGVAPAEPGYHPMIPPTRWGGNLDTKYLVAGSRVILPVGVDGALFSMGDAHAAMGDGEVCGTAVEVGGGAILRLSVIKGQAPDFPHIEVIQPIPSRSRARYHVCTGVGPDLMEAARNAVRQGIDLLCSRYGRSRCEAYALLSVAADLKIHEIVDAPNWVIGLFLPDFILTPVPDRVS